MGHVFNLGHGVPPDADPDVLARIVDLVHTETRREDWLPPEAVALTPAVAAVEDVAAEG
jgi:hypothetical protein